MTIASRLAVARAPKRLAWGMAGVFFGYFFHVGILTPYWPLWLGAQGASAEAIGTIIALTMVARTLGQPLFSYLADHLGRARVLLWSAVAGAALLVVMPMMGALPAMAAVAVLAAFCLAPLVPVSDALTVSDPRLHYGRVRLWGSVGFICANILVGMAIAHWGTALVVPLAALSLMLVVIFALVLPRDVAPAVHARAPLDGQGRRALLRQTLRQPALWWLMGAVACINGSHGFYYAFATKYWRETMGLDATWIGLLWATGVVAEIAVLAWLGGRKSHRAAMVFMAAASGAAVVRWLLMAQSPPLGLMFLLQSFHALSFGAWQLGSVQLLRRLVPADVSTSVMGVQSALAGGVAMAAAMWLGGLVYGIWPEAGFILSAAMAALGGLLLWIFAKTWRQAAHQAIEPHENAFGDDR